MQETVYFGVGANSPSPHHPSLPIKLWGKGRGSVPSAWSGGDAGVVGALEWWGPRNGGDPTV